MIIEYYATEQEDRVIERAIEYLNVDNAFNPEEGYYVIDTRDTRVLTVMGLLGVEMYVTDTELGWHQFAFGTNKTPESDNGDK